MTLGSMDAGEDSAAQLIQLEPLIHQVSGHSSLWVLDDVSVCKPLIGREAKFYQTLPPQMKSFTAEFRGTIKVLVQRTSEGVSVAALPPNPGESSRLQQARIRGSNQKDSKEKSGDSRSSGMIQQQNHDQCNQPLSMEQLPTVPVTQMSSVHNPWLQQCHQRYLKKLRPKDSSSVMECILLENLTHMYRIPNVLDLKMGTRQYGDDAPESKRFSQTRKAQHTTTPRLGVRLAGMQVFNKDTKCYVCKNKYVGRELSEEGFQQNLRHFLHNGRRFRVDIVEQIICKLTHLKKVVTSLDSFRFFTSSLLILYDSYDAKGSLKGCKDFALGLDKEKSDKRFADEANRNSSKERVTCSAAETVSQESCLCSRQKSISKQQEIRLRKSQPVSKGEVGLTLRPMHCSQEYESGENSRSFLSSCSHCNCCEHICLRQEDELDSLQTDRSVRQLGEKCPSEPNRRNLNSSETAACRARERDCSAAQSVKLLSETSLDKASTRRCLHENLSVRPSDSGHSHRSSLEHDSVRPCLTTCKCSERGKHSKENNYTGGEGGVEVRCCEGNSCIDSYSSANGSLDIDLTDRSSGVYRTKVDIRLIDFAHATHKDMGDSTIYSGPDEGLLLGLKSLIKIFSDIKEIYAT